jgi:hypothetical protein
VKNRASAPFAPFDFLVRSLAFQASQIGSNPIRGTEYRRRWFESSQDPRPRGEKGVPWGYRQTCRFFSYV